MNSVTLDPSFFRFAQGSPSEIALAPKPAHRERRKTRHRVHTSGTALSAPLTQGNLFERLPPEISSHLAKKLSRLRDINAFFRSCVYASTVLRDHFLDTESEWLIHQLIGHIRPHGPRRYDHLPPSVASRLFGEILDAGAPDAVRTFINRFRECRNVCVTRAECLADDDLHTLFDGLTHVNQLSLVPSPDKCLKITESGWSAPMARIHDLISLSLAGLSTTDVALPVIAHKGTKLTSLSLEACPVSRLSWHALIDRCQALETLLLRSCTIARDIGEIDTLGTRLSALSLSNCEVTDALLAGTAHYKQLTALDLSANRFLSDRAVGDYINRCPALSALDLSQCERIADTTATAIADICTALGKLSLNDCQKITECGLKALAHGTMPLEKCSLNNCHGVTDSALAAIIAERGSHLRMLSLAGCDATCDAALTRIATSCPHLEILDLSECSKLTGDGLAELAEKCSRLTTLRLSNCTQIADDAIESAAPWLTHLSRIDLGCRQDLSEKTLLAIARHCTELATLRILGCDEIASRIYRPIMQNGTRLHGRYAPNPLTKTHLEAKDAPGDCVVM